MSSLMTGGVYSGFQVVHQEAIREIESTVYTMEHQQSGARLLYVENQDDNKVFSVTFRTPPEDSTGVFHILEHSVLCGSAKFPVKEPFVELLKGSMKTFLNAFTFSDKTMYPVASRNHQDYANLMEVYLDSVFQPNIYGQPEIFEQEGWHYDLAKPEDELIYKGVVYNEMKGSYSSPVTVLIDRIKKSLFPDTIYRHSSGGDPQDIPALTYEQFLDAHRNYYHPSNSYFYLYGDVDIEDRLKFIHEEYLSRYTRRAVDTSIALQQPTGITELAAEYPILAGESAADKTYVSLNYVMDTSQNRELNLAFAILKNMLMDSNAAPLKQALLESGLGKDVVAFYSDSMAQPMLGIALTHSNPDAKEEFVKLVRATLSRLAAEGLDQKLVLAAVNSKEFELREADFAQYPKGLTYSMEVMKSWLYDGPPSTYLEYEAALASIREQSTDGYFERLIETYLLNSSHSSVVVLKPSQTLASEREAALRSRLTAYQASLTTPELDQLVLRTQKLLDRQNTPDAAAELAKLPKLTLSDIDRSVPDRVPTYEHTLDGIKVLHHEVAANTIGYIKLYWDTSVLAADQIPYLEVLARVLGQLETEAYSIEELTSEIGITTGGIRFQNEVFGAGKAAEQDYQGKFSARIKVMQGNIGASLKLLNEMLYHSRLDHLSKLQEIVRREASAMEAALNQKGNEIAASRVLSYFSDRGMYEEQLGGVAYYQFIKELARSMDRQADELADTLKDISEVLFNTQNVTLSVTGTPDTFAEFAAHFTELDLRNREIQSMPLLSARDRADNEGFMSASQVQYVIKGYDYKKLGFTYSGKLQVLKKILSLTYLWNAVRVKGGAYGANLQLRRDGVLLFTSYRDPNLQETLEIYDQSYQFAADFAAGEEEMEGAIIGTLAMMDQPLSPGAQGRQADRYYFEQLSAEDLQRERDEILAATAADIRSYAGLLQAVAAQNYLCVVGNEAKLKSASGLFGSLEELVK